MQDVCPPLYGCVQGTGQPPICAPGAHARWWALQRAEDRRRGLAGKLAGDQDQAAKYGGAIGATVAGLSVLGLGAYIGSRLSSPQHKTRGALVGAGVAVLPAYVAAMMGGMIMGGVASGRSPI